MLTLDREIRAAGLSAAVLVARGVDNSRTSPELTAYRRQVGRELAEHWKNRSLSSHPELAEYERVHRLFGVVGEPAAPEKILRYVRRHQDLMPTGAAVDCYNLVSAQTLLSIGAHDLAKLEAPVVLRRVRPGDRFVPLGETAPRDCTGEYAYLDPHGQVICRLEVLQGEATKVDAGSREIVFFLQDNRAFEPGRLLAGAWYLAELIEVFCGGTAELVGYLDARRNGA